MGFTRYVCYLIFLALLRAETDADVTSVSAIQPTVTQKCISWLLGPQRESLVNKIRPNRPAETYSFGQRRGNKLSMYPHSIEIIA